MALKKWDTLQPTSDIIMEMVFGVHEKNVATLSQSLRGIQMPKSWSWCPNSHTAVKRQKSWSCCPNVYAEVRRQEAIRSNVFKGQKISDRAKKSIVEPRQNNCVLMLYRETIKI